MNIKEIDMTYCFLSDDEPTDEQMDRLMRDVGDEVRRKKKKADKRLKVRLHDDIKSAF